MQNQRNYIGFELDNKYHSAAVDRLNLYYQDMQQKANNQGNNGNIDNQQQASTNNNHRQYYQAQQQIVEQVPNNNYGYNPKMNFRNNQAGIYQ